MIFKNLHSHAEICQHRPMKCPNVGCDEVVTKGEFDSHIASCVYSTSECTTCGEPVTIKSTNDGSHARICKPKPLPCPYKDVGCEFEALYFDMQQHLNENAQTHNELHLTKTKSLATAENNQQIKIDEFIAEVSDKIKSNETELKTWEERFQGLTERLTTLDNQMHDVSTRLESKADAGDVSLVRENLSRLQSVGSVHESRITRLEQNGGSGNGISVGDAVTKLQRVENTMSSMELRQNELELRMRLLETASYNGKLIWRLTNYAKRKQDAVNGRTLSLYSQPFYTSQFGYKMCARVYLNGDGMGKGTHLSLFFVVMRGECDPLLQWPFRQRVSMSLLDQSGAGRHITDNFRPDPTSTSFQKPRMEMNIASGSPMFAEQTVVESDKYLRDDTIFIRITVDITDLPSL